MEGRLGDTSNGSIIFRNRKRLNDPVKAHPVKAHIKRCLVHFSEPLGEMFGDSLFAALTQLLVRPL